MVTARITRWLGLDRAVLWMARRWLGLWVRPQILPQDPGRRIGGGLGVVYVLERRGLADLALLEEVCLRSGLPRPWQPVAAPGLVERRSVFSLSRMRGFIFRRPRKPVPARLERLVAAAQQDSRLDLLIVPVTIFWGRFPDKEKHWFKVLFGEKWSIGGRLRKFFVTILQGRNTLVQFSEPIRLRPSVDEARDKSQAVRRIWRVLRVHYRRLRIATIGPDLSHRRTLVNEVVASRDVRRAIDRQVQQANLTEAKARVRARRYAYEIAADYSYTVIRFFDRVLGVLWNRLYDGICLSHVENLHQVSEGNEIIYVPCHRSHIDYMLLSYIVHQRGMVVPHVAAGINLNLPLVGRLLRRGGAFFLRRSFRGNALYTAVFRSYLAKNLAKGVAIEYFIEGGRSRTGRLLQPRSGLLAMTVQSFLENPRRPIVFVPVYIGYEKLVEGETYIGELRGSPKKKESVAGIFRALPELRSNFGKVHVNIGEPIFLGEVLTQHQPGWRSASYPAEERPGWLHGAVDDLAIRIMTRINDAAAVNPVTLLAIVLLSTPKHAMVEEELAQHLTLFGALAKSARYSPRVTVTDMEGAQMIAYGEKLGVLRRRPHPLGDIVYLAEHEAVLMTYFRNNVLHLFALPSLLACCFLNNQSMTLDRLVRLADMVFPYLRTELFLRWREEELPRVVERVLRVMSQLGLLQPGEGGELRRPAASTIEAVQLSVLAQGTVQTLERFYMTIALLLKHGSGSLSQRELESLCELTAQRMSWLYEFNAPEFFDKSLFHNFIEMLRARAVVWSDDADYLVYDDTMKAVAEEARLVLSEQIRHSILQVTHV